MNIRQRNAVLALGGGGARGVAHVGAVEVVRSMDINIDRFVGISIGSLVGALSANELDSQRLLHQILSYLKSDGFMKKQAKLFAAAPKSEESSRSGIFSWYETLKRFVGTRRKLINILSRPSLLARDVMQHVVDGLLPDVGIEDLQMPLSIVAVDLHTGDKVVLEKGSVRDAVIASTAIPGIFPPVAWDDMLLCDVGVLDPVPSLTAKAYARDLTIAVDVCAKIKPKERFTSAVESFIRMNEIAQGLLQQHANASADLLIRPNVEDIPWFDFSQPEILIEEGRRAALNALNHLRNSAA